MEYLASAGRQGRWEQCYDRNSLGEDGEGDAQVLLEVVLYADEVEGRRDEHDGVRALDGRLQYRGQ